MRAYGLLEVVVVGAQAMSALRDADPEEAEHSVMKLMEVRVLLVELLLERGELNDDDERALK